MDKPIDLKNIRIITVSGRIASGSTTLAKKLAHVLQWKHIEGGEIIWEASRIDKLGASPKDTNKRPDNIDFLFDKFLKKILKTQKHIIVETKLAGFNAQKVKGVFKILVVCDDEKKSDQAQIRIDRLVNREAMSVEAAKEEILQREKKRFRKMEKII